MRYNGISKCKDLELYSVAIMFDKCKIASFVTSNLKYSLRWRVRVT